MQIETVAVLMLGGAWDQDELSDNDIAPCGEVIESMQQQLVKGGQDVHIELVDRAHVDRVTAERDALQQLLNARDEEVERLRNHLQRIIGQADYMLEIAENLSDPEEDDDGSFDECREYILEAEKALENQA